MANTTSSDPSTSTFEAAVLQDLIKVAGLPPTRGTHRDPVLGFKLLGLGVRDAALTYRATQHPPSLSREVGVSQQCRRPCALLGGLQARRPVPRGCGGDDAPT